jgi:two-component system chemotaxis response regulator CheY
VSKSALVVDDSVTIRKMVSRCLQQAGFETVDAANGKEALTALESHRVSVIITDFNMPVMDGLDFVQRVRESASHKFTPIVFLTTEVDPGKQAEARAAGITAWVIKPFTPDKVLSVVNRVVPA